VKTIENYVADYENMTDAEKSTNTRSLDELMNDLEDGESDI